MPGAGSPFVRLLAGVCRGQRGGDVPDAVGPWVGLDTGTDLAAESENNPVPIGESIFTRNGDRSW